MIRLASLATLLVFAACTPLNLYYKAGATVASRDRAELACRVSAEQQVPPRLITRVIAGGQLPPHQVCPTPTTCRMVPGRFLPPEIITEDVNTALRLQVARQCMADKGYQRISLPPCPAGVTQTATAHQTTVLPRLRQNSCVIRGPGGVWQIVNPG